MKGEFLPAQFHHTLALKNAYHLKLSPNSWLKFHTSFEVAEINDSILIRYGNDLFWGWDSVIARGTKLLAGGEGLGEGEW